jgi:hypothetical protein
MKCMTCAPFGDTGSARLMFASFLDREKEMPGDPMTAWTVLAKGNPLEVPRYVVEESISKADSASSLSCPTTVSTAVVVAASVTGV